MQKFGDLSSNLLRRVADFEGKLVNDVAARRAAGA
jgi:hypothetical protein